MIWSSNTPALYSPSQRLLLSRVVRVENLGYWVWSSGFTREVPGAISGSEGFEAGGEFGGRIIAGDAGQVVELHHDEHAGERHRDACPRRRDPSQEWHQMKACGRDRGGGCHVVEERFAGKRSRKLSSVLRRIRRGALSGPWKVRREKRKGGGSCRRVEVSVLPPLCSTTASIRARRSHHRPYSSKT